MDLRNNIKSKENFTLLIESIENDLYNIAENKITDTNDVEDVIQETIIKIYNNIGNLKNKKCFKAWAIKILLNECNKNYNNKTKDVLLLKKIMHQNDIPSEDSSISELESNLNFKEILRNLSTIDQDICIFYYQCNFSIKEISKILQVKESTIKSRIKRSKEKLEKIMKGDSNEN